MITLPPLPYAYDALEPHLDARTVEIHYTKHHKGYVDKLNEALAKHPEQGKRSLEDLLRNLETVPEDIRLTVRNMGGGVYNHNLFWAVLTPEENQAPHGKLADALRRSFGDLETFKEKALKLGGAHFASGWLWLSVDGKGGLVLETLRDHDCPLSRGLEPIFTLDLWEHGYYLKFQNRRPDFLQTAWRVIHWNEVGRRYEQVTAKRQKIA